jgi:hypothetical protein
VLNEHKLLPASRMNHMTDDCRHSWLKGLGSGVGTVTVPTPCSEVLIVIMSPVILGDCRTKLF